MFRITIIILSICFCSTLWCQSDILATLKFDSTNVLIGDQLRGSIIVNAPQGKEISFPTASEYWKGKNIEIFNLSNPEKLNAEGGKQIVKQAISLIFWDTGTYILPALPFGYINGDKTDTIFTKEISISVSYPPGVTGDSTYMAPIKPILEESKTFWDYIMDFQSVFIGVLSFLLIAGLAYFVFKMQKAAAARRGKLSPEGKALNELQKLLDRDLIKVGQFSEYHESISWIVRDYLHERFRIKALEAITSEILESVNNEHMSDALKRDLKELLETADLVKYAKASPLASANEFAAEYIRKLVAATLEKLNEEKSSNKDKR
jgi:hypothetical protein